MEKFGISQYFIGNFNNIYRDMHSVFKLDPEIVRDIIIHLISISFKDDFYKEFMKVDSINKCFKKKNLLQLNNYFSSLKFTKSEINLLLKYTPEILLYSNRIRDIYPLYKSSDFKGYVLLNGEDYRAYDSVDDFLENDGNNLKIDYSSINNFKEAISVDIRRNLLDFENNLTVKSMLELLKREDVKDYYGIDDNSSLREKFDALSSKYNKRNYYFYKVENPLIAQKVKKSTYGVDKKYHCDLCNRGYDTIDELQTAFIVPLEDNGADEIYNMVCLCKNCYKDYKNKLHDITYKKLLIESLTARIAKKNPEYLNKIRLYFKKEKDDDKSLRK